MIDSLETVYKTCSKQHFYPCLQSNVKIIIVFFFFIEPMIKILDCDIQNHMEKKYNPIIENFEGEGKVIFLE